MITKEWLEKELSKEQEKRYPTGVYTLVLKEGKLVKHYLPENYTVSGYQWLKGIARKQGQEQDIEDIMQEVLLWAFDHFEKVLTILNNAPEGVTPEQMLAGILKHQVKWSTLKWYQRLSNTPKELVYLDSSTIQYVDSKQGKRLAEIDYLQAVYIAISNSKSKANKLQAYYIVDSLYQGYTVDETANMLGIDRKQVYRGIAFLQRCLATIGNAQTVQASKLIPVIINRTLQRKRLKAFCANYLLDAYKGKNRCKVYVEYTQRINSLANYLEVQAPAKTGGKLQIAEVRITNLHTYYLNHISRLLPMV